ncbi:MAG TPA: glycosyltransferase [Candidatus Krumholzibacteria bacterium]|nr:glycosyltransferase [Candidatus Krumholzibacteria bacterium]HPD72640.1 glycosyltransferase [Candidatus Krumholzibacteria bacterium]HRY40428.1 glycosyltransferase [Candidatus Krumholzibacteria bacterium]
MNLYDLIVEFESTWVYLALLVYFAWYPIGTSAMWIYTAIIYYRRREQEPAEEREAFYHLDRLPPVSFVIPAYNEEANIEATVRGVLAVDYPDYEVVVIDDCSTDATLALLEPFAARGEIRLVRKRVNEGKAMALNDALPVCNGELLFVMDADAVPDPDILKAMVPHFQSPRVGGVTGNPRVANRTSFLAKLQAIEFASIISLMRRAQRVWGRIMTMSGVVGIFRREALQDVGYYSPEMATEDIDLTWRLQIRHWDIRYESRALMWMHVPQSLQGLWRQRRRWALGLSQVLHRHWRTVLRWEHRRFWPVLIEANLSVFWAYTYVFLSVVWLVSYALGYPPVGASPIPNFWGMFIATVCVLQLVTGVLLDRSYDRTLPRYFVHAVFYPLIYWILMAVITVVTHPRGAGVNRQRLRYTLWKPVRE